jgi:hypothetical protein
MSRFFLLLTILLPVGFAAELKLLSWNLEDMQVFYGNGLERPPLLVKRENAIVNVFKKSDADVIVIQEAPSMIELQYLVQAYALPYRVAHVRNGKGNIAYSDAMGALIHKRHNVIGVTLEHPPVEGSNASPSSRYRDWSMRGIMQIELESIIVMNIHLKSPGRSGDRDDLQKRHR